MKKYSYPLIILLLAFTLFIGCKKVTGSNKTFYTINTDECTGCGKCFDVCPHNAVHLSGTNASIIKTDCKACGKCVSVCPNNAIW